MEYNDHQQCGLVEKENKEKRMKRNEDSLRDHWENIKHTKICIIQVSEGEERERT